MTNHLSVSQAARKLGANPKDISDLFYRRRLRDDLCPVVAGRRMIPEAYLEMIAMALTRAGRQVRYKRNIVLKTTANPAQSESK